jgi:isopentenyldiphosphate isomerase
MTSTSDPKLYYPSATDGDLLPIVDEQDVVIGSAPRRQVHAEKLRHRAVHAVVVNGEGQVLLQLRSSKKDSHPGWWDISMGGHVDVGEEYEVSARRELREELGIAPQEVREVTRRAASPESGWEFVRIYHCRWDGPVDYSPAEIDAVRWVDPLDLFRFGGPSSSDPMWRVTGSGFLSFQAWGRAKGIIP